MRVRRAAAAAIALSADPAGAANNAVDLRITRFFVIASHPRTRSVTLERNPTSSWRMTRPASSSRAVHGLRP